jgi:hypothetical protein
MTNALTTKELDLLVSYCDLAVRQGGLNVAADALALAQKLLTLKNTQAADAAQE